MDIDIRPVPVDKLVTWAMSELESRRERLEQLQHEFSDRVVDLQKGLEEVERIASFVEVELAQVELSIRVVKEDIVRVVCPACQGTGMKASDALSGHVSKGSAFESVGKPNTVSTVIEPHLRCVSCKGQRWVIMERFKG